MQRPRYQGDFIISGKDKYLLLSNDSYTYNIAKIKTNLSIRHAESLMKEAGYKIKLTDKVFEIRIPPRCAEIVKIEP